MARIQGQRFKGDQTLIVDATRVVLENVACDPTTVVGDWVRVELGVAYRAQANSELNSQVVGVIDSKSTFGTCNIVLSGLTSEIFTSLDTTKDYFLQYVPAGVAGVTIPTAANSFVVKVGKPYTDKIMIVNIGDRYERP